MRNKMQQIIDLSIYLENDIVSDPPGMLPEITYFTHRGYARADRGQLSGARPGTTCRTVRAGPWSGSS